MRTFLFTAIAATCLIVSACAGDSSTSPHSVSTLAGSWVGTQGDLTIHMQIGADTLCSREYGYCTVSGVGTYTRTDGSSGSFGLSADYWIDGSLIVMNIGGFGTDANCLFNGKFDSKSQISGMLYETSSDVSPLNVGIKGFAMKFVRQ